MHHSCCPKVLAIYGSWLVAAGDGNCGYRAVLAGLIEGAQGSCTLKAHLLQRLPEVYCSISRWTFTADLHPDYGTHLESGFTLLMVSTCHCYMSCFAQFACFFGYIFASALTCCCVNQACGLCLHSYDNDTLAGMLRSERRPLECFTHCAATAQSSTAEYLLCSTTVPRCALQLLDS